MKKLNLVFLFVLVLFLLTPGCRGGGQYTVSPGERPRVMIETPHLDEADFRGLIANYYLDQNYNLETNRPGELVLISPPSEGALGNQHNIIEFNFISLRNQTRIIAKPYEVTMRGGQAVDAPSPLPPEAHYNNAIQEYLDELARLVRQEEAFEELMELELER